MANTNPSAPQGAGNGLQNLVQSATSSPIGASNETPFYASNCTPDSSSTGATGCHSTDPPDGTFADTPGCPLSDTSDNISIDTLANDFTDLSISASTSTPVRVPAATPFHDSFLTPVRFSNESPHSVSTDTPFRNSTGTPFCTLNLTSDGGSIGSSISASTSTPGSVSAGTPDSATTTSVQVNPVQRSLQRLEAISRYLKITEERQTHNIVNICSFNITPLKQSKSTIELIKRLLQTTLDHILPDMLLLQEPIWSGGINVKQHITKSEQDGNRYSFMSREWESYESPSEYSNTEVVILFDPKVLQRSFSHELISESWSTYMNEVVKTCELHEVYGKLQAVKGLPLRTMAFGAMSTQFNFSESTTAWYQYFNEDVKKQSSDVVAAGCQALVAAGYQSLIDMETEPSFKSFIGISLHMFLKETNRSKADKNDKLSAKTSDEPTMTQDAILFISEEVIKKAENLAVYFKRPVIIGADWNVKEIRRIKKIIDARETAQPDLTFWHEYHESDRDSIVCIYPNKSEKSNVVGLSSSLKWRKKFINEEFPTENAIIRKAFINHEPIVVNIKPMSSVSPIV